MVIEAAALLNRPVTHMTPAALFDRRLHLKKVIKKARSLLAAGPDFFFGSKGHKSIVGLDLVDPGAVTSYELFVKEALLPGDSPLLTVTQAFEYFTKYCQLRNLLPIQRNVFKGLISDIIREEYGMALRRDLKNEAGKFTQGWKGLLCRPLEETEFTQLTEGAELNQTSQMP